jgi:bifunctional DNA-binding transcriptional regulator/antitoxin component of YhaV-PrlF toxin-antitoxin module
MSATDEILCESELEIGAYYELSLPEEVRHVLGIAEESVLAICIRENENTDKESLERVGLVVPCIWGKHFFPVEILGTKAVWKKAVLKKLNLKKEIV